MKLIYQWMLAFFGVIMTTIVIVGIAFTQYSTKTAYNNTWDQLEGYASVIEREAFKQGSQATLSKQFIDDSQAILSQQRVSFNFFNAQNEMVYPAPNSNVSVKKKYWKYLKKGQVQRLSMSKDSRQFNNDQDQLVVFKPVFYNDKLIYVIGVGSSIKNVKSGLVTMRKNLLIAFLLSTIGGILLSYVLARYQIYRISRLRNATHLVAEGDFDVHIDNPGKDELDDLATDFNEMVHSLNESEAEIKRQEDRRRQFMADVAHEMRTPLTTVKGLLEGLAYDAIPEEMREKSISLMQNETNRLIRLVNENLDYEKIRTNQIKLNQQTFNAVEALQNIQEQLQKKAADAGDTIVLEAQEEVAIYADYDRFVQVMFNIMQNAIQFTNNGQITVTAEAGFHETILTVSDTGIGMTPEQVKNIWERYYKADPSRKNTKYGESGLGLAIVHQLVQLHHGTIEVQSEPDQGTTFTLTFPDETVTTDAN
ncbi:HAMP domain-containing histidine kinase [Latilactobacillus sakei]|uniref:sensor histidine kinase n=1 Tax=Latilactobacillus sakei TaxID=1599 RepID=UPI00202F9F18|nr:HAMP domain-containing sensor histidine kinase [Latilactobacillus sakei]MCM1597317.1 HAMP domain-containing histidine kinase [Latilactobacillus sakei]